ncbi:LPPG:FO 2-phospho-L-lactate transferase [Dermatophilus congolensis]|uniref:Putative gluconeogenesis factor n=1 Tax=Dermatophilus congolensis TaxID=1863 RepID=A0A239VNI6_9MICO|nr:uridine diphosphate-N-acetylglucosamine-binding protein YvcK [Dermatophilus congolensis]SNV23340.1 LPPG:FO 2-phospho-L-lactate transferase [Dermatophilus congolensis]
MSIGDPRVVALGGGHGLAASLGALRHVTDEITAVVTVADDGGSSGRLRREYEVLPPGDLRMAVAALCDDTAEGRRWRQVLQHRYGAGGPLEGHAAGNLLILTLWDLLDDPVAGLDALVRLVDARGRVLPMAGVPLVIEADVTDLVPEDPQASVLLRGQVSVAKTNGQVASVRLDPADPPACPEALDAIDQADWVILGPGSWFTSVMPHMLVPQLRAALCQTSAKRVLTLNLSPGTDETSGYTAARHIESLAAYAPGFRVDAVLADPAAVDDEEALRDAAAELGATVVLTRLASNESAEVHDTLRLAAAYRDLFA